MSWLDAIRRLLGISGTEKETSSTAKPASARPASISQAPAAPVPREKDELIETPTAPKPVKSAPVRRSVESVKPSSLLTGDMTQFPTITSTSQKLLLNIGLDFGTAFAKVVIGESRASYAVPFELPKAENPYLLPCVLYIDDSGACSLQPSGDTCAAVTDLKMKLLDETATHQDLVRMVAFIALILRHTRLWLMQNHRNTYERNFLDWYVNVGVPTDSYHCERLTKIYHNVVMAAWGLSVIPASVSIAVADELLSNDAQSREILSGQYSSHCERLIHKEAFGVFPEFVAQVVGYVRSPLCKPDLHMMVDVGAGTVDISIFNVYEIEEDEFILPIYAKDVKPYGTHFLMKHRQSKALAGTKVIWSEQEKIPSEAEFQQTMRISMQQLREIDNEFIKMIGTTMRDLLKYTKEKRYPKSPRWQDGIPTFLCGGGGNVDVYSEIVGRFENGNHSYKVRVEKLPQPKQLKAPQLPENSYDRLSVAYGLSYNAMDINLVIQANMIADVSIDPIKPNPYSGNFVSKECV